MHLAYKTKMGATAMEPGVTIGGIRLTLYMDPSAAHTALGDFASFFVGCIVGPDTLDPDDISPLSNAFLDWEYYEVFYEHFGATAEHRYSYQRQVRAMRKIDEIGNTLWLAADGTAGGGATVNNLQAAWSAVLILP